MAKPKTDSESTGLILVYSFITLFLTNALVLYFANLLFPKEIVLGTLYLSKGWAIYHSTLIMTVIGTLLIPIDHFHEAKRNKMYTPKEWMIAYFLVNFVSLWLISRLADNLGLGISAWWVALILAAAYDWIQGLAMMALTRFH